ncbi:MAG: class I SAM-dependent methyltransferase [bacterium]
MPNYPPLRRYVFAVVDRWIARHGLQGPFLEVGCGTGLLAAHLGARGWSGVALDSSRAAAALARERLVAFPGIACVEGDLAAVGGGEFRSVFMLDVLEHVSDDEALLGALASRLAPGGCLVLLVPVNPPEWRADDELYGHYRRYGWEEIEMKLGRAGLAPVERWNVTVPVMWLLRRLYLAFLRPGSASGSAPRDTLTAASSYFNPWDRSGPLRAAGALTARAWWRPLFVLQDLFARSRRGHAAMFLSRKPAA